MQEWFVGFLWGLPLLDHRIGTCSTLVENGIISQVIVPVCTPRGCRCHSIQFLPKYWMWMKCMGVTCIYSSTKFLFMYLNIFLLGYFLVLLICSSFHIFWLQILRWCFRLQTSQFVACPFLLSIYFIIFF